ncbi:MAG: Cd(II)/Pb(II)-responsive transcriptional regulator [Pseudomonadota bacterium]|nr:Cd(II)/Pb(II)-responsive transcriptional regulator [Pseudomonadota bacterium]
MKIGEIAASSDTPVDTIRYYEREGLLPAPARTGANYRRYEQTHLVRLRFIRHCRHLDMSLDEVRELLAVCDNPDADPHAADRVLDAHIGHVNQRMRELSALQRQLKALRARCAGTHGASDCGILATLAEPVTPAAQRTRHLGEVHGR